MRENILATLKNRLNPHRTADKEWYLSLLDEEKQLLSEKEHICNVLLALKKIYILRIQNKISEIKREISEIKSSGEYSAADYREILEKNAAIAAEIKKLNAYKCFFAEPYFARMDVVDDKEGYNAYYIGKKGDVNLEIVDWRAPLAVRYYQKSRISFTIGEYEYRAVLRRALSVKNGKLLDFKNEYLSVKDVLTQEEIAGRDEEILFDPYLRSIIKSRKDDTKIRDIIETIQEKQFDIITKPERESFILQGCAGSGKTMILLHRLSYLMYNNEKLSPRDVLVITPSDSFNAFIDELAQVLELKRVKTVTLQNYFFRALQNEGIDLVPKLNSDREDKRYLEFLYSDAFVLSLRREIGKLYDDIYGLFTGKECVDVAREVLADCRKRQEFYVRVKNSSVRVRRSVLGEMKENAEGGFYFTKPFRTLMSAFVQAEDFLRYVLEENARTPDYFFRQFVDFFRCAQYISRSAERVFRDARRDLRGLSETVEKEIADLRRYRQKRGDEEVLTYPERIAHRIELKQETEKISAVIGEMERGLDLFTEFYTVLRTLGACNELGACRDKVDVTRWLYRRTVKKYKNKYDMKGIYPSDGYALCAALTEAGRGLTPRYGLVFIDEGQDISKGEYELLHRIHGDAAFNVFGDLKQRITPWRGIDDWGMLCDRVYELNQNYRNTNEIVDFVSGVLEINMQPIGLHGEEIKRLKLRQVSGFFKEKQGLKAVIAREEHLHLFNKRGYKLLSSDGKISKTRINVMTVFESKGLEFSAVTVYDADMTENEKYIAYTRALRDLAVAEE